MKKLALGFMAIAISFASIAQEGKKEGHKGHKGNKEFKHKGNGHDLEKLNLSAAQGSQLKAINENFRNSLKALKSDNNLSKEAKKERMQSLKADHKSQIQAILTAEQKQQWEAGKKERGNKERGKKGKGRNK